MIIFDKVNKFVLHEIDLHVPKGIVLGIIGASGSGKTTFLKLIVGLLKPESGFVATLRKNPVSKSREITSHLSALFSNIPLYDESLSIRDNLDELRIIYGIKKIAFEKELERLAKLLDFSDFLDSKPGRLSLGQKRRCELGLTFLHNADLYLFDEPCMGLDQNGKAAFYKLVEEKRREGKTILLSSHSMEDISTLADRVLLLDKGQMIFYGSKEELYKRLAPVEKITLELEEGFSDISDLEVEGYSFDGGKMSVVYNSNHVSSKEVLERICAASNIKSVSVKKANLAESIKGFKSGRIER